MIPTLQTLSKICRVYGVTLSYFFAEPKRHSLSITRKGHLASVRRSPESVRQILSITITSDRFDAVPTLLNLLRRSSSQRQNRVRDYRASFT